jgi:hypothetical protein
MDLRIGTESFVFCVVVTLLAVTSCRSNPPPERCDLGPVEETAQPRVLALREPERSE